MNERDIVEILRTQAADKGPLELMSCLENFIGEGFHAGNAILVFSAAFRIPIPIAYSTIGRSIGFKSNEETKNRLTDTELEEELNLWIDKYRKKVSDGSK